MACHAYQTRRPFSQQLRASGRYWYVLAMRGLILDRPRDSVTLEAPSTNFASVRVRSFLARGGENENNRTPATGPPQPSDAPAFPSPRSSCGQDGAFYRSFECLARRLFLRLVGAPAGWNADRSDPAHARGSDREFSAGDALYRARRPRTQ